MNPFWYMVLLFAAAAAAALVVLTLLMGVVWFFVRPSRVAKGCLGAGEPRRE